jgi:hypothetical protein
VARLYDTVLMFADEHFRMLRRASRLQRIVGAIQSDGRIQGFVVRRD